MEDITLIAGDVNLTLHPRTFIYNTHVTSEAPIRAMWLKNFPPPQAKSSVVEEQSDDHEEGEDETATEDDEENQ